MRNFNEVRLRTKEIEVNPSLEGCKKLILSVIKLLDSSINSDELNLFELFTDDGRKLAANASWFLSDPKVKDHKATYLINEKNNLNIDFKLFGVQKLSKRIISWSQALTPNFEDEPFYPDLRIGIDFLVPKTFDRVLVVLSNNYVVRILELHGPLTATYEEIFAKWESIEDYSNKRYVHTILWESFDLHPINKRFYEGIQQRFTWLKTHLEETGIHDSEHAAQFANRLVGRIIFCWFLDKKNLINPTPEYFNSQSFKNDTDYYRGKLEPLFFKVLNTPISNREPDDLSTPYLNGGLFEPKLGDMYGSEKLTFPANYFDDLFEFFQSYNFTTDESTSQFQQVAIDPEMLGRIFENLLAEITEEAGEQARKAKGAFYTPREIVDYMCREALRGLLISRMKNDEFLSHRIYQLIDAPDREFQDQDHNWRRDWKPYKDEILRILDDLKVFDPACGSGAFPMGMLQLLVKVYERLEPRFDAHKAKLQIIEKNIFGADIEPMAVEISRLRVWLSLIVDVEGGTSKVQPLPNLDFKFVCANTLIPLDLQQTMTFGDDPELANKLQGIREQYFTTENSNKKSKLRTEYEKLVNQEETLFGASIKTSQLKTYRPFEADTTANFFESLHMFGFEKFDIVIANPPYISAVVARKTMPVELRDRYKSVYKSANGAYDLYILFFELGFNLLKEDGVMVYITPRKYLSALYGESYRAHIGLNKLVKIADFYDDRVFKSASVSTLISVYSGKGSDTAVFVDVFKNAANLNSPTVTSFPRSTLTEFPENSWGFLITQNYDLLHQAHQSKILIENQLEVNNSSTVTESVEIREALSDKPMGLKMINTGTMSAWISRWGRDKYSNGPVKLMEPYLDSNKMNDRRAAMYRAKKIIISKLSKRLTATVDAKGEYASADTVFVFDFKEPWSMFVIAGLLNSSFMDLVYRTQFAGLNMPGEWYQFQAPQIRLLPLPEITVESRKHLDVIAQIASDIFETLYQDFSADIAPLQKKLDEAVYRAYGIVSLKVTGA
jgi:type I restriction-modification system DNA methylase subunit